MSSQGRIARSFLALASGDAVARVIAFGAAVLVARRLGPEMLGIVTFASAVLLYFKNGAQCGIDLLGVRHISEDEGRIRTVAPSILGCRLVVSIVLTVVVAVGAKLVLEEPDATVLALFGLTLLSVGPDSRWIHLGLQHARPVAIARTLGESLFFLVVLAVVFRPEQIAVVPVAQFAGDMLCTVLLFLWLRQSGFRIGLAFDWKSVQPIFRRAFPLVLNVLLGLTIYNADLVFLYFLRDKETVGYYGAAYQLISFLTNMGMAYSISLLPALTRLASDRAARNGMYATSMAQVFAVAAPLAVGGAFLAAPIVRTVYGDEFSPSGPALAVLLCMMPFTMSKEVDLISLVVAGREKTVARMTALAVVVNVALNLALIPTYGMMGAAVATLATEVARAIFAAVCVRSEGYPLTGLGRFGKTLVASGAMAGALAWLAPTSVLVGVPLGAAVYAATLALVGGLRFRGRLPVLDL